MNIYSPVISGSLTVTGSTNFLGNVVMSGSLSFLSGSLTGTASNSSLLDGTGSLAFATTSSFATTSGSVSSRITQIETVYATTGSNSFRANQSITGSLTVSSTLTAQTLVVQTITSSILYSSGSNNFGCDINSRQTFTGSFYQTGSVAYFGGNVGIGVLSPGVALDVNGYVKTTGVGLNSSPTSIGANPNYVRLTNTGGDFYIGQEGPSGGFFTGAGAYESVFYAGRSYNFIINGSSKMYVSSSGNVGIGISTPTSILDVRTGAGTTGTLLSLQNTTGASASNIVPIRFYAGNSFGGLEQIASIWAINPNAGANNGGALVFATSTNGTATTPSEKVRIDSNGVTCFSNTICSPTVYATGNIRISSATSAGNSTDPAITTGGCTKVGIYFDGGCVALGSAGNQLLLAQNGNVGVNTATPLSKLHVEGDGFFKSPSVAGYTAYIGSIAPGNTGDRYLHVKLNTISSMMFWVKVFGYAYGYGLIEGFGTGYLNGTTGTIAQGYFSGQMATIQQNNNYAELVIDTIGTGTTNRWGSITLLGGTDNITTIQPLNIVAYSWTSTTTRVY